MFEIKIDAKTPTQKKKMSNELNQMRTPRGWLGNGSTCVAVAILMSASTTTWVGGESIWLEGERPDRSTVKRHGWYSSTESELLSGGAWLSHFGDQEATAEYTIEIPESGNYSVWARVNPSNSEMSFAWQDQDWRPVPMNSAKHRVNVAKDAAVDIRFLAWVKLDRRALPAGTATLRVKFHSKNQNHGGLDAIFLTDEGLEPVGKGNPAVEGELHQSGYFAWSPGVDPLGGDSPIDLRHINETMAGESGFVRRDGDRFLLGSGEPVRFWAVQNGLGNDPDQYDRRARRLAKYGVNLVRMGGGEFFRRWREDRSRFDELLDDLHLRVAALKKAGIYVYLDHLYWHTHHPIDESVYPGFGEGRDAIALIFFENHFQEAYRQFLADLMQANNPHTGLAMADDPAVAFLEIHNESSLLFHTFVPSQFPETERALVEKEFGDWLIRKYGTHDQAFAAWKKSTRPDRNEAESSRTGEPTPDDPAAGRIGLYRAGVFSGADWAVAQRNQLRAADQLQFMVEVQLRFYQSMRDDLRSRGIKQLIVPSNWKTADPQVLDGLERYTYTGGDLVCRNSHFGVDYAEGGRQKFYEVEIGDTYRDGSALKSPGLPAPLGTPLIEGVPFMVTENNWTRPNRYRVEWPMTVASYASLQGIDGWTFFSMEDVDWRHSMGVWDLSNPSILGQFPAAALMYRRGDVETPASPVVAETVSLDDAFRFGGTKAVPLRGEDALWKDRIGDQEGAGGSTGTVDVDPLAYFVGPIVQSFGEKTSGVDSIDLDRFIDHETQTVRSVTGELTWNADKGFMAVDTPRAQGAWGFLKDAGRIELQDTVLMSENRYGSILVISLDDQPLATSRKVLIQTGSWDQPYGFETESQDGYKRITKLGGFPLNVRRIQGRVVFKRPIRQGVVLDGNGYATDRAVKIQSQNRGGVIELPDDAIYTLIE